MINMTDRIAGSMLERMVTDGSVSTSRVPGHNHIFRLEFETAPGSVHSRTIVWYEFEDEVQQFSEGWFHSVEECEKSFRAYCEVFL